MFNSYIRNIISVLFFLLSDFAFSSNVESIKLSVYLDSLGTGHIYEEWTVDVDQSATEMYISMKNLGEMSVKNFRVYDNDNDIYLENQCQWLTQLSREEKKGKCGVVPLKDNGCELCWGVGTEGRHVWTACYDLIGLVRKYDDGYGFNHCFINHDINPAPKTINTNIFLSDSTPLTPENVRIWGFHYPGICDFADGYISAYNTESISSENEMIIMCIFKGLTFNTPNVYKGSIVNMKTIALDGSDYLNETYTKSDLANGHNVLAQHNEDTELSFWETLFFTLVVLVLGAIVYGLGYVVMAFLLIGIFIVFWNIVSLRPLRIFLRRRKLMANSLSPYFREIPVKGDLNRAFYIIDDNNYRIFPRDKDNLYAAYLVRLLRCKALSVTYVEEKGKMVNRLKVNPQYPTDKSANNNADSECMSLLYNAIKTASGENLILDKGELKKYLSSNRTIAINIDASTKKSDKTPATPQEYSELMGLKKFLQDYTLIESRGVIEVEMWDEYLVYASLFGIADQVIKNIKKYSPEYFQLSDLGKQMIDGNGHLIDSFNSFTNITTVSSSVKNYRHISSAMGGGGYSSSGGGGGHSGGGGGGGCR